MRRILSFAILSIISAHAIGDSMWTCQSKAKVKTIQPSQAVTTIRQSSEVQLFDDGTMLGNNHINSFLIPGTYQLSGRKAYFYPDHQATIDGIYEAIPGVSEVQIISNYTIAKFNKPLDQAKRATVRGYVDEQFVNANGVFVRVVGVSKGKCRRL